jgi:hypothetical protein
MSQRTKYVLFITATVALLLVVIQVIIRSRPFRSQSSIAAISNQDITFFTPGLQCVYVYTNVATEKKVVAVSTCRTLAGRSVFDYTAVDWKATPSGYDITETADGLFVHVDGFGPTLASELRIKYPIKVGDRWKSGAIGWPFVHLENTAEAIDIITTTLGTFQCVHISTDTPTQNGKYTKHYWYSRGIGLVKYVDLQGEFELTKFEIIQ